MLRLGGLFDELQGVDTDWSLGFAVNCILSGEGFAPKLERLVGDFALLFGPHMVILDVGIKW